MNATVVKSTPSTASTFGLTGQVFPLGLIPVYDQPEEQIGLAGRHFLISSAGTWRRWVDSIRPAHADINADLSEALVGLYQELSNKQTRLHDDLERALLHDPDEIFA